MDFSESTRIVYSRIQQLEPQLASKIIGYLLLQDNGDREMIRLAFGPDNIIRTITDKIKTELSLLSSSPNKIPVLPSSVSSPPPPIDIPISPQLAALISPRITTLHPPIDIPINHHLINPSHILSSNKLRVDVGQAPFSTQSTTTYLDSIPQQDHTHHHHYCTLHTPTTNFKGYANQDHDQNPQNPFTRTKQHRRNGSGSDRHHQFPVKVCHYFLKGFCKHGSSCKYFHGTVDQSNNNNNLFSSEDIQMMSPGSLEKLEWELTELLKFRNGAPVSIAMLPMLYYERYGRNLQAQGYLTESQRHGKAGFSLTKLLARMNSIRLIDRAHGQHVVILAEDLTKYLETNNDQHHIDRDHGPSIIERQIYLTFPAESTFSEEDVSNYFSAYGPVQDVRIPNQQQRMYGFVSFVYAETVRKILAIGNPHFICNSRVLAKPYKEKSKLHERKNPQRKHHHGYRYIDGESELHHGPRMFHSPRAMRKHFMEQFEPQLELERRRIEHLIMSSSLPTRGGPSIAHSMAGLNLAANQTELPAEYGFNFLLDVLNTESAANEERGSSSGNDQESDDSINLPDSPFAGSNSI